MTKVYPNACPPELAAARSCSFQREREGLPIIHSSTSNPVILTVWKKSLLFNCDGFTVFDSKGNLVFRVDNYIAGRKGEIVLMDASGTSLLTIRRKRLSLADNWLVYEGETSLNPLFSVRKHVNFLNATSLAHVTPGGSTGSSSSSSPKKKKKNAIYEIEGCYAERCCTVYDVRRRLVAEIKRKEAPGGLVLGVDVFRLIVQPDMDTTVAMALVVLLDQMFGSSRPRV